jgi:hypothetical protein
MAPNANKVVQQFLKTFCNGAVFSDADYAPFEKHRQLDQNQSNDGACK